MTAPAPAIDLAGRTALVTGASRGICLDIARVLARCEADVIGVGTAITGRAADIEVGFAGLLGTFRAFDCDLSDRSRIDTMIAQLDAENTAVDILVNNAGIIRRAEAPCHSTEEWDAVVAVDLDADFLLSREFGRRMLVCFGVQF